MNNLFISQPLPASKIYHVFGKDNKSLCGRYALLIKNDDYCEPVTGNEVFKKGQDCKSCFDKLKQQK